MYTTGGFSYKQYPHSNQLFVNQYLDANSQHFIKHSRGGSYDSTRTPQLVPSFNTPPKPNIFQNNNTREISEFFSETKAMKNKIFEEKNKTYFSPQKFRNGQLINEIVDYMENKKKSKITLMLKWFNLFFLSRGNKKQAKRFCLF